MKRFMLFCGQDYYASGGMLDFVGSFDTIDEAAAAMEVESTDWGHIYDTEDMKVVRSYPLGGA